MKKRIIHMLSMGITIAVINLITGDRVQRWLSGSDTTEIFDWSPPPLQSLLVGIFIFAIVMMGCLAIIEKVHRDALQFGFFSETPISIGLLTFQLAFIQAVLLILGFVFLAIGLKSLIEPESIGYYIFFGAMAIISLLPFMLLFWIPSAMTGRLYDSPLSSVSKPIIDTLIIIWEGTSILLLWQGMFNPYTANWWVWFPNGIDSGEVLKGGGLFAFIFVFVYLPVLLPDTIENAFRRRNWLNQQVGKRITTRQRIYHIASNVLPIVILCILMYIPIPLIAYAETTQSSILGRSPASSSR